MQSRLFTIFMTMTIAPPLMQQLQPRYLAFRSVYQSRESKSKIYSWPAFTLGAILPEIPYSLFCGGIFFCCWYFGVGLPLGFPAGYAFMMICLFEIFYIGLGQFIAALAPNPLFASFWKSWMYWVTPFHYLLEGQLGVISNNVPVVCDAEEFARFPPPPGMSCASYTDDFVRRMGGYVQTGADGLCDFCQYANGNQFSKSFNVFYHNRWRNFGLMWVYDGFNFIVVFFATWMYLGGARKIKSALSPKDRRLARERRRAAEGSSGG
jgi:ATP-binding cassette subfamily G (WHITE) protein 2 (SNQ2)